MMIDTHAHIDLFDNQTEIIDRAIKTGVTKIILPGVEPSTFEKIVEISNRYDFIWGALGVHPSEIDKFNDETLKTMISLIEKYPKIIAIGEIGLDYHYSKEDKEKQKDVFKFQLEVAEALNLPVLIHDRDAHKDTFDILEKFNLKKVVFHCYSGSLELAKECVKKGYYFGIGGVVTFKNAKTLKAVVEWLPLEKIMLETDCPYLAPTPFRGEQNEPSYLGFIASEIANIKNLPKEIVIEETSKNALKFFNIEE